MAFSDNIWWTRKAKIQAEKRLLANAFQAQVILLWYSFSGVAVSVYYLKFDTGNGDIAGTAWVLYSVLVLCMSGFINGLSFKERAALIKESYETLNDVYQRTKLSGANIAELSKEYEQILGVCENHLDSDYYLALCEAYLSHPTPKHHRRGLDRFPTCYIWINVSWSKIKRLSMLFSFYALPIVLLIILECMS